MSTYTVQLRFIAESLTGETRIREVIDKFRPILFSSSYPFPEDEKEGFERHIIQNFYNREIGYETWALFHFKFNTKMSLIMPKYGIMANQIKSKYNALFANIDIKEQTTQSTSGTETATDNLTRQGTTETETSTTATNTAETQDTNRHSDTPQGGLTGLENNTYMSSADLNNSSNTANSTGTGETNTSDTVTENRANEKNTQGTVTTETTKTGYSGSKSFIELMSECNSELLNLTECVCRELNELFISLY